MTRAERQRLALAPSIAKALAVRITQPNETHVGVFIEHAQCRFCGAESHAPDQMLHYAGCEHVSPRLPHVQPTPKVATEHVRHQGARECQRRLRQDARLLQRNIDAVERERRMTPSPDWVRRG